jgi:alpha-beta hydrolase superfamily lysophospholipase
VENHPVVESTLSTSMQSFTASDGYRWQYRHYPADGARVVCIHGIQSHGGWYEHSCRCLAGAGFDTFFLDRRGSGLNEQARGDTPGFRRLLDDIAEFLRSLRDDGTARPIFLLAISWGGKLALALQRRHPGLVEGLLFLCPGFCPQVGPSRRQRLVILGSRLLKPRRLFPIPLSDPALFTVTPQWQNFIRDDPFSLRQATARFLIESARLDGYLRWIARGTPTPPTLLLLAEHDRIIDNARTRHFLDRFPCSEREVITYPGAHHTLEFEPEPERFIADVITWLERQSKARDDRKGTAIFPA